ncbi:LysR family transcriptional regulator [Paracoccus xiamenensis]|uniref:LysR family transcriptional regulator n=1 Tax=Paracoccus xiamenensis TaxID=2714901 RepID=UPI00140CBA96|nr:LysR family transcriptional regulator [Paracoccus xiamenensis]NHF74113.1 LysR family transcriptional regulator [Paracoccus xiamenensis]
MMDLADGIRAFLAVVETGSFTAAGQRLGVSNKQAGKQVAALEARLGQNLLYRTTRAVSLTEAGEAWLPHARKVLSAMEDAEDVFADPAGGLSGRLRITCGTTMGELCVAEAARSFATEHPRMRVELHLSDELTDLAAGGFDMAVRIGIPRDSSLLMQRIGATTLRVAGSPDYLAAHGTPAHPRDLADHVAIIDLNGQLPGRWNFRDADQRITIAMQGQIAVNSAAITIGQALKGGGLVCAPDIFLAPYLDSGALRSVLDDFATPALPIHILSQPTAFRQRKIAAFGAVLRRHLDQLGRA